MKKYTIELTEEQLEGLAYACRVTDRLIIGKLDFSLQKCCEQAWEKRNNGSNKDKVTIFEDRKVMMGLLDMNITQLRWLCWGQSKGTYNGVGYDSYADMLFDMQKVMRHAIWLELPDNEKNRVTNDAYPHTFAYGGEPLMKVKPCKE